MIDATSGEALRRRLGPLVLLGAQGPLGMAGGVGEFQRVPERERKTPRPGLQRVVAVRLCAAEPGGGVRKRVVCRLHGGL